MLPVRRKEQTPLLQVMDTGDFVFIQEMGTGSHRPVTKSLIKMHVMDRVVMQRRARKEESSDDRDRTTGRNQQQVIPIY
jgi:hypothetical protein